MRDIATYLMTLLRRGWASALATVLLLLLPVLWLSYLVRDYEEIAAALPTKVYDPIGWVTLLGALLLGVGIGWSRRPMWRWGWILTTCALFPFFFRYISKLPTGDNWALYLICLIGLWVGLWVVPALLGRSGGRS